MKRRTFGLGAVASLALAGCSSKFRRYDGPEVTAIVVNKAPRRMYLLHDEKVLKSYKFHLGFAPAGHKIHRGDGRTPEGLYYIDRRNPNSDYHLSIGISYPNAEDIARARALGLDPGGDIFIHGEPNSKRAGKRDWTAGCIAVKNNDIEEIYAMVRNGTAISLRA